MGAHRVAYARIDQQPQQHMSTPVCSARPLLLLLLLLSLLLSVTAALAASQGHSGNMDTPHTQSGQMQRQAESAASLLERLPGAPETVREQVGAHVPIADWDAPKVFDSTLKLDMQLAAHAQRLARSVHDTLAVLQRARNDEDDERHAEARMLLSALGKVHQTLRATSGRLRRAWKEYLAAARAAAESETNEDVVATFHLFLEKTRGVVLRLFQVFETSQRTLEALEQQSIVPFVEAVRQPAEAKQDF